MNLFKSTPKAPIKITFSIKVIDEKRTWYKNGNHKLHQKLAFIDENGNQIGEGKIIKKQKLNL